MKKYILLTILITLFFSMSSYSQAYKTAIGIRSGNTGGYGVGTAGFNIKHFVSSKTAIEGTIGGGFGHIGAQGLFYWQFPTNFTEDLDWYLGFGVDVGLWSRSHVHPWSNNSYNSGLYIGAVGVGGMDYKIPTIPLNVAAHIGPYIGLLNSGIGFGGSVAVRYILK